MSAAPLVLLPPTELERVLLEIDEQTERIREACDPKPKDPPREVKRDEHPAAFPSHGPVKVA